jgi:hypothetical protein
VAGIRPESPADFVGIRIQNAFGCIHAIRRRAKAKSQQCVFSTSGFRVREVGQRARAEAFAQVGV